jgi:molybdopterin biosynthesis enzyme MoaB
MALAIVLLTVSDTRTRAEVSRRIADPAVQVVISSGGTGLTGRDDTPEAVAPLLPRLLERVDQPQRP